jgi:hypothetical protein
VVLIVISNGINCNDSHINCNKQLCNEHGWLLHSMSNRGKVMQHDVALVTDGLVC